MHRSKLVARFATVAFAALLVAGCPKPSDPVVTLSSVTVAPATATVESGQTQQLTATGTYSDGHTEALTSDVAWSSSNPAVATVSATGLVTGVATATASAVITATSQGKSGSANLTITYLLNAIAITGPTGSLPVGFDVQLAVEGTWSGNVTAPVTSGVTWQSSAPAVATVDANGRVHGVAAGTAVITATHGGKSDTFSLTVAGATLASIAVQPPTATLIAGHTVQLEVVGTFSDGSSWIAPRSSVTWTDDGSGHAQIDAAGLVSSVLPTSPGPTTFTATVPGAAPATATVTVSDAVVESVRVYAAATEPYTIADGQTLQLTAEGTLSDGTTRDLTGSGWSVTPSDGSVATVDATGLARGQGAGTATVTYTEGGVSGSATLTVTAAYVTAIAVTPATASVEVGLTQQYTATATMSDGATGVNVTSQVAWSCPDASPRASVSTAGLATALSEGTATIQARDPATGVTATATLTITAAPLISITITPDTASVAAGRTYAFTIAGTYSTGTVPIDASLATWTGGGATVVDGVASSTTPGTYTITAAYGGRTDTATLTVTDAVPETLTLTPATATIQVGGTQQFAVDVVWSDALVTHAATFSSSAAPIATIDSATGLATGVAEGAATITATLGALSDTSALTVQAGPVGPTLDGYLVHPDDFPFAGAFTASSNSSMRYELSGLTPGQAYEIGITGVSADSWVDVVAFADSDFWSEIGYGYGQTYGSVSYEEPLRFIADSDGTVYLEVWSQTGVTYTLDLPVAYTGPALTATLVYPGSFPFSGASASGDRYYLVTGLTPGVAYTFDLGSSNASYSLGAYADRTFLSPTCGEEISYPGVSSCGVVANANGQAYLRVFSHGSAGTVSLAASTRSAVTPSQTLTFPGSFYFSSTVTTGSATWYRVTGLTAGTPYLFVIEGAQTLWIYDDVYATDQLCATEGGGDVETCWVQGAADGDVYVAVDGRVAGGAFTLQASSLAPSSTLAYPADFARSGTMERLDSVAWQVTGLTPGAAYSLSLSGVTGPVNAAVLRHGGNVDAELCWTEAGVGFEGLCVFTAPADGSVDLLVTGWQAVVGADYTVDIDPVPAVVTTIAYPGEVPHAGAVGTGAVLYEITGLTAGGDYTVTLSGLSADADLYLFEDSAFSWMQCSSTVAGTAAESCAGYSYDGSLYVLVDGRYTASGASFTLDVASWSPTWTVVSAPGDLPYAGATAPFSDGYVRVDGLTPGASATLTLSDPSGGVDMEVWGDAAMTSYLCYGYSYGATSAACTATVPPSGQVYLRIYPWGYGALTYTLDVTEIGGTAVIPLAYPADLPLSAAVDTAHDYYQATGLPAGAYFAVYLESLTDDADVYVYSDAARTTLLCSSTWTLTDPEMCAFYVPTSGTVYVDVDGTATVAGSSYNLYLSEYWLDYATSFPTGEYVIAGDFLYYYVDGYTAGASYTFSLTGLSEDLDLYVYDADTYAEICSSLSSGTTDESCAATVSGTAVVIMVDAWYATVGSGFTLDMY